MARIKTKGSPQRGRQGQVTANKRPKRNYSKKTVEDYLPTVAECMSSPLKVKQALSSQVGTVQPRDLDAIWLSTRHPHLRPNIAPSDDVFGI